MWSLGSPCKIRSDKTAEAELSAHWGDPGLSTLRVTWQDSWSWLGCRLDYPKVFNTAGSWVAGAEVSMGGSVLGHSPQGVLWWDEWNLWRQRPGVPGALLTEGTLAGWLDLKEMPTEMMWGTLHWGNPSRLSKAKVIMVLECSWVLCAHVTLVQRLGL